MASCSIENKPKNIPSTLLIKGVEEWNGLLRGGKNLNEASAEAYVKHIQGKMEFVEWVDFLNSRLLLTNKEAAKIKNLEQEMSNNYDDVAADLGLEFDKSDNLPERRRKLKAKNTEINNEGGRFQLEKDALDTALSDASKGRSEELDLVKARAITLGREGKKVFSHSSADLPLLIDLLIPTSVDGKNYKKGIEQKKKILDAIEGIWNDVHRISVKKGISVSKKVKDSSERSGIKLDNLYTTSTLVPISGLSEKFYTEDIAVQTYLLFKSGQPVSGIPEADITALIDAVEASPTRLKKFSDELFEHTDGWFLEFEGWNSYSVKGAIDRYYSQTYVKNLLKEHGWTQARKEIFGEDTFNKIRATYKNGDDIVQSITSVLNGMQSGRSFESDSGREIVKFLSAFTALPIGGNIFIGIKQLSSFLNFVEVNGPNSLGNFMAAFASGRFLEVAKDLAKSDYAKNRLGTAGYDINLGLLTEDGRVTNSAMKNFLLDLRTQAIDLSYKPVSYGDLGAILIGGPAYIINYQNFYMSEEGGGLEEKAAYDKAFLKMTENAETTQQSRLPTRVSAEQRSLLGKIILPYKTFQQQAVRKARTEYRNLKRLGKDATLEQKKKALANILYYRAVSPIMFSLLTSAAFAGIFDDEDDEKKRKWAIDSLKSMIEFNLVGYGIWGAITAIALKVLEEAYDQLEEEQVNSGKLIKEIIGIAPGVSVGLRQFDRFAWEAKGKNPDKIEMSILAAETAVQIPLYNLYNYIKNYQYLVKGDASNVEKASLILGVKPYTLGLKELK